MCTNCRYDTEVPDQATCVRGIIVADARLAWFVRENAVPGKLPWIWMTCLDNKPNSPSELAPYDIGWVETEREAVVEGLRSLADLISPDEPKQPITYSNPSPAKHDPNTT